MVDISTVTFVPEATKISWKIDQFFNLYNSGIISPVFSIKDKDWTINFSHEILFKNDIYSVDIQPNDKYSESRYHFRIKVENLNGYCLFRKDAVLVKSNHFRCEIRDREYDKINNYLINREEDSVIVVCLAHNISDSSPNMKTAKKVLEDNQNKSTQTVSLLCIETLSKDLKELLDGGRHTDVKIKVGGKVFQAHKCVLAARSKVLDSMFSQQMLESINGVVNISDCDSETFEDFLTFLYSGKLDEIVSSRIVRLYEIADKYDHQELKKECVRCCVIGMSVESVCDAFRIAALHDEEIELMEKATYSFVANTQAILLSLKWEKFHEEYPRIANELFLKSFMSISHSKASK